MANELSGAVKNALEKGEALESIKQSFLNAGYPSAEVNQAINEINLPPQNTEQSFEGKQPFFAPLPPPKQNKPHFPWIAVLIIVILAGAIAALAGMYWDKILSFFE